MVTIGKSTLGNSSTPSRLYEASPRMIGALTSMIVKTGRLIQTSQIVIPYLIAPRAPTVASASARRPHRPVVTGRW